MPSRRAPGGAQHGVGGRSQPRAHGVEADVQPGDPGGEADAQAALPDAAENNVRAGFLEHEHYLAMLNHLPECMRPVVTVAYVTGWRIFFHDGTTQAGDPAFLAGHPIAPNGFYHAGAVPGSTQDVLGAFPTICGGPPSGTWSVMVFQSAWR